MHLLIYLLTYPILWCVALLPFRLFYGVSDFIFLIVFHIAGYRRTVVRENLKLIFPEKTDIERSKIERQFYKHFCDIFMETIKSIHMNDKTMEKRYRFSNLEVLDPMFKQGGVLLLLPHYGNWEWSTFLSRFIQVRGYGVYQRIANPYFDRMIRRIRSRWNTTLIPREETFRVIQENEDAGVKAIYGLVSDQSPMISKAQYWAPFMGIKVPIFIGAEVLAHKHSMGVVYGHITREKRGHYSLRFIPITQDGSKAVPNEVTDQFLRLVEENIREAPQYYFWTHRRWKHRGKAPKDN